VSVAYLVELTARAERDLNLLYAQIHVPESMVAARWFNGLEQAIYTLERSPRRCPIAPGGKKTNRPLRHLLYGRKPDVYRVIYEIQQPRRTVRVLTIRHGAIDEAEFAGL
jgi:toxin ParE1/3/4